MLAEELGVSRIPVREALKQLQTEGFVDIAPRRGAVVAEVSMKEAEDFYEVRSALESFAAAQGGAVPEAGRPRAAAADRRGGPRGAARRGVARAHPPEQRVPRGDRRRDRQRSPRRADGGVRAEAGLDLLRVGASVGVPRRGTSTRASSPPSPTATQSWPRCWRPATSSARSGSSPPVGPEPPAPAEAPDAQPTATLAFDRVCEILYTKSTGMDQPARR